MEQNQTPEVSTVTPTFWSTRGKGVKVYAKTSQKLADFLLGFFISFIALLLFFFSGTALVGFAAILIYVITLFKRRSFYAYGMLTLLAIFFCVYFYASWVTMVVK